MRKTILSSLFITALAFVPLSMQANATSAAPVPAAMAVSEGKVNLNTADVATLQKELAGIGMAKAKAIVAFREENGAFTSVDELLEVQGIGKALVDRNRDRLAVN